MASGLWDAGVCLERGADLHMAQLMPLPLTVSCFSKIQIGFTFLVPAYPGSTRKRAVKWVCVSLVQTVISSLFMWLLICADITAVIISVTRNLLSAQSQLLTTLSGWLQLQSNILTVADE